MLCTVYIIMYSWHVLVIVDMMGKPQLMSMEIFLKANIIGLEGPFTVFQVSLKFGPVSHLCGYPIPFLLLRYFLIEHLFRIFSTTMSWLSMRDTLNQLPALLGRTCPRSTRSATLYRPCGSVWKIKPLTGEDST